MAERVEKRSFIRLNIKANIRYRTVKSSSKLLKRDPEAEQLSVIKNLSAGGLVFVAHKQIPVGSIVELRIELPAAENAIECSGRVVRIEEIEIEKSYDIAVCFLDLSGADRMKLEQFVKSEIF